MLIAIRYAGVASLGLLAILAVASPTFAASVAFRAELKGVNTVPANLRSNGRGILAATYDTVSRRLTWTGTHSNLSSKITGIHFHAPAGHNKRAGVVLPIESLAGGSATLSDDQAADLIAGYWYVDIHTRAYRQGEIRGQVMRGE